MTTARDPGSAPTSRGISVRRVVALFIDWGASYLVASALLPGDPAVVTLVVFAVEQIMLVGTVGYALGHRLLGLRVTRPDGSFAGPVAAIVRTVLLLLVVPPLLADESGRGLHDRVAGTVISRRVSGPGRRGGPGAP